MNVKRAFSVHLHPRAVFQTTIARLAHMRTPTKYSSHVLNTDTNSVSFQENNIGTG